MKRKITRQSLEELRKLVPTLSYSEQTLYVGGGTGTPQDPYTFEEYQNLVSSGTWLGGFVAGSTETYTRDKSGNFVKSEVNDAIYIEKDCRVLPDLVVDATRKDKKKDQYDDNSGFWGFSDDNDRDSSGTYISDPSGNWTGSENLAGGGGGGSSEPTPWDRSTKFLKQYGVHLQGKASEEPNWYLGLALESLSKSPTFVYLMQRLHTHGVPTFICAKPLTNPRWAGGTSYIIKESKSGASVFIEIDPSFLNSSDSVGVGGTVLHEMIHGRLQGVLAGYNITRAELLDKRSNSYAILHSEAFKNAYPGLYDYYSRCNTTEDLKQAEHEIMAAHYRPMIVKILKDAYPHIRQEDCEALSWSGLQYTRTWKNLEKDTRDKIMGVINKYKRFKL